MKQNPLNMMTNNEWEWRSKRRKPAWIQAYRTDLAFYTNGRSVCLTELKGYQATVGEPIIQPRRPNSRLDKVRHMFSKIPWYATARMVIAFPCLSW